MVTSPAAPAASSAVLVVIVIIIHFAIIVIVVVAPSSETRRRVLPAGLAARRVVGVVGVGTAGALPRHAGPRCVADLALTSVQGV